MSVQLDNYQELNEMCFPLPADTDLGELSKMMNIAAEEISRKLGREVDVRAIGEQGDISMLLEGVREEEYEAIRGMLNEVGFDFDFCDTETMFHEVLFPFEIGQNIALKILDQILRRVTPGRAASVQFEKALDLNLERTLRVSGIEEYYIEIVRSLCMGVSELVINASVLEYADVFGGGATVVENHIPMGNRGLGEAARPVLVFRNGRIENIDLDDGLEDHIYEIDEDSELHTPLMEIAMSVATEVEEMGPQSQVLVALSDFDGCRFGGGCLRRSRQKSVQNGLGRGGKQRHRLRRKRRGLSQNRPLGLGEKRTT
ncbi:hypothetical protein JKY72_04610 [Candidatus Gracilibacteria bacterium]|nr:hypothetical protein [Candidatus Gracilibacteria bacterium]